MNKEQSTTVVKYDPNTPVAVSSELYNISKYRWHMNTLGYRTLFCIAQCMDRKATTNVIRIKKDAMFEYLGITTTNRKYELLNDTLSYVRSAGFESCSINQRGKRKWEGHSWITDYEFGEDGEYVNIHINGFAKPFLAELKQFALIQPKTYLRLSTDYQNWFYPLLKLRLGANGGRWELTIDQLAEQLSLEEKHASYRKDNKDRVGNILKKVIGIQPSERFKEEQKKAKAEHRKPKFMAWDWIKGKDGKPTGTLYTITKETDIEVVAQAEKDGRSYSKLILYIREKEEFKSSQRKAKEYEKIRTAADDDMGKRKPDVPSFYHTTEELQGLVGVQPDFKTVEDVAKSMGLVFYKDNMWVKHKQS